MTLADGPRYVWGMRRLRHPEVVFERLCALGRLRPDPEHKGKGQGFLRG